METNTLIKGCGLLLIVLVAIPVLAFVRNLVIDRMRIAEDKALMIEDIGTQMDSRRFVVTGLDVRSETTISQAREYEIEGKLFAAGVTRIAGRVTGRIAITTGEDKRVVYDSLTFEYNDFGRQLLSATGAPLP